jgi:hypothetical protein
MTLILGLGIVLLQAELSLAQYAITWSTVDGGGGTSSGGGYELSGTIGQPDAAFSAGGGYDLTGGFWVILSSTALGDCDGDGDVDGEDYAEFEACLAGPGVGLAPGCDCFDLDADEDTDLLDFAEFQVLFNSN